MLHIIALLFLGAVIGYIFRNACFTQKTETTISFTIIALLFVLGWSIGSNDTIISNLFAYGSQAAILAVSGLLGSVLMSGVVYHFLYKKGGGR